MDDLGAGERVGWCFMDWAYDILQELGILRCEVVFAYTTELLGDRGFAFLTTGGDLRRCSK